MTAQQACLNRSMHHAPLAAPAVQTHCVGWQPRPPGLLLKPFTLRCEPEKQPGKQKKSAANAAAIDMDADSSPCRALPALRWRDPGRAAVSVNVDGRSTRCRFLLLILARLLWLEEEGQRFHWQLWQPRRCRPAT